MTKELFTITEDDCLLDAIHLMRDNGIRRLPVVKDNKLIGMITEKDVDQYAPSKASTLDKYEMLNALSKSFVKDAMTKDVITVNINDVIETAAILLHEHRFGGLPVLDDDGTLVGLITAVDIFEIFAESMGFKYPSTRIAILLEDKEGALAEMTAIFHSYQLNIISLSTFFLKDKNGARDVIIRVSGDKQKIDSAVSDLKKAGYNLMNIMDMEDVYPDEK